MFGLGSNERIIIAVILVLLFGGSRIPALTKGVADAIRTLRGAFKDEDTNKKV